VQVNKYEHKTIFVVTKPWSGVCRGGGGRQDVIVIGFIFLFLIKAKSFVGILCRVRFFLFGNGLFSTCNCNVRKITDIIKYVLHFDVGFRKWLLERYFGSSSSTLSHFLLRLVVYFKTNVNKYATHKHANKSSWIAHYCPAEHHLNPVVNMCTACFNRN
jgi:hypothetical protein